MNRLPILRRFHFFVAFLSCVLGVLRAGAANDPAPNATANAKDAASIPQPNRTLPPHDSPKAQLSLSSDPSEQEIRHVRFFVEPLLPVGRVPTALENHQLASALRGYASRVEVDDFSELEQFVASHPDSPWGPALIFDLGMDYFNTGFYSKSLATLERAWTLFRGTTNGPAKPLADRAVGELAYMYARLGRMNELNALLHSLQGRALIGPATERIAGARQGLWSMQHRPEKSFLCGPAALDSIRFRQDRTSARDLILFKAHSTTNGYSLAQLARLSRDVGLNYQMVRREQDLSVPLPAVVHWKVGHYAAVVGETNGGYFLQDATFRHNGWISKRALAEEASGYFLVPPGADVPSGWRAVSEAESAGVWGRGGTDDSDPDSTTSYDQTTNSDDPNNPDPNNPDPNNPDPNNPDPNNPDPNNPDPNNPDPNNPHKPSPCPNGMAVHQMHLMLVSLNIRDTPLFYDPPVGRKIHFTATYNQREAGQPATFAFANLGPKWTFNWLAYIEETPNAPSRDVEYHPEQGGVLPFAVTTDGFAPQIKSQAILTRTPDQGFEMLYRDGTKKIFSLADSLGGNFRRVFMTAIVDPQGNAVHISYDGTFRVVAITDAIGQVTTLSYENPSDQLKITRVSDPFGRKAIFRYDAEGRLTSITDCIGLVSQFNYGPSAPAPLPTNSLPGDFIQALTTPYGTTIFACGELGRSRWLEATYPNGEKERLEYSEAALGGTYFQDPGANLPLDMSLFNGFFQNRSSYFWGRGAYPFFTANTNDYSTAKWYHWLHLQGTTMASGILESRKYPLEGRVWYNYDGQPSPGVSGSSARPIAIARTLDDGTTQLRRFSYNAAGKVTSAMDPIGRSITYVFSTNSVDLLEIRQTTGTNNELLAKSTYNLQHLPVAIWDAAGMMTTNTFNARGQLISTTNPRGETTSISYDTNGYVLTIDGPLAGTNDTYYLGYDLHGRVGAVTNVDGYFRTFSYDNMNRLTNINYPDGTSITYTFDNLDRVKTSDRMHRETLYSYDSVRRLVAVQDALGRTTRLEHCGCGAISGLIDPMGRRTAWEHDVQGRQTAKQYADGSRVTYNYEHTMSRLKSTVDEKGQFKLYAYNLDDTIRSISYPNAQIPTATVTFSYDPHYKRVTSMEDGIGMTTWSYYPVGVPGALAVAESDGPWFNETVFYAYDSLGRITNRTINGLAETFGYDSLLRITNVANVLGNFTYTYDGATARLLDARYPNGQTSHFDYYDNSGDRRLKQITHLAPDASVISRFIYSYNGAGMITNWVQVLKDTSQNWTITNDAADQLLAVTATQGATNDFSWGFGYDSAGNRLFEITNGVGRSFAYNALNELFFTSDPTITNVAYEWDAEKRLTAITAGSHRSEFSYDGLGRRVRIVEKDNTEVLSDLFYVWDGLRLCEERASDNSLIAEFLASGEQIWGTNYYYGRDHLGSVRTLTDRESNLVSTFAYSPFGVQARPLGHIDSHFGFTGHFRHPSTRLLLGLHRAYSPSLGRWLSRDPLNERVGPNLYAYVGNSPLNWRDPLGLDMESFSKAVNTQFIEGVVGGGIMGLPGGPPGVGLGASLGGLAGIATGAIDDVIKNGFPPELSDALKMSAQVAAAIALALSEAQISPVWPPILIDPPLWPLPHKYFPCP